MNVQMIMKESFSVIGKVGQGLANRGREWIPPLWEKANGDFSEISSLAKYDVAGKMVGIWGLMSDVDVQFKRWGTEGKYLAGCEVKDDAIAPVNWTLWRIPSQTYVVVACTQESYGQAFNFVLNEYLPDEGYEVVGAIHEYYPQDAEKGILHLYFPVEKVL